MEKDKWCSPTNSTCSDKLLHTCVPVHRHTDTQMIHMTTKDRIYPLTSTYEYCTRRPTTREQPLKIRLQTMPTPSVWSIFNFSPSRNICFLRRPTNWLRSVWGGGGGGEEIKNSISGTLVRLWKGSERGEPFAKNSLYPASWENRSILAILHISYDLIVSNEAHRRMINGGKRSIYFTYVANYATRGLIALGKIQMYLNGIQIVALCLRHR